MKFKSYKIINAFSLVELLAVIAIIGILTSLAAPAYSAYVIRSKISGALDILPQFKNYVTSYESQFGSFPSPTILFTEFELTSDLCQDDWCQDTDINWPNIKHIRYSDYGDGRKVFINLFINASVFSADNGWVQLYCGFVEDYLKCACGARPTETIYKYLPDSCRDDINNISWFDDI